MVTVGCHSYRTLVVALMHFPSHEFACVHDSQRRETVKYGLSPAGLGTKNDCAGEGQQQFTRRTNRIRESVRTPRSYEPNVPPPEGSKDNRFVILFIILSHV
jgi:hypothetical protein